MIIFICGFMGAGKTTFLKSLGAPSDQLIDTDYEIWQRFGSSKKNLGEWIESVGWKEFRMRESELIVELAGKDGDWLIGLGGGSLSPENLETIKGAKAKLVWLRTPFEVCLERLRSEQGRPLAKKTDDELMELYESRIPYYQEADLSLDIAQQQSMNHNKLKQSLALDE